MIKVLIIENDKITLQILRKFLNKNFPPIEILAVIDKIKESKEWLCSHPMPDLIFANISLRDGCSFEIFHLVECKSPIVFMADSEQYALRAFKENSIDYLLKPISEADLREAINKYLFLYNRNKQTDCLSFVRSQNYKSHFLLSYKGGKLIPLAVDMVQYFCISDGSVKAVLSEKEGYAMSQTLDSLSDNLDPDVFFRVNRQYLISKKSVKDIDLWFNNRLVVNLKVATSERVVISKARISEFKAWFCGENGNG
ncbi:MAG: LytTR family DNA-binding domain-containing protein [Bacteroidales bacterium]